MIFLFSFQKTDQTVPRISPVLPVTVLATHFSNHCFIKPSMATQELARERGFLARSVPPELILCILQSCGSRRDLLALVSTCRYIYQVWQTNPAAVLLPVSLREISHFHDALTAVSCPIPTSNSSRLPT